MVGSRRCRNVWIFFLSVVNFAVSATFTYLTYHDLRYADNQTNWLGILDGFVLYCGFVLIAAMVPVVLPALIVCLVLPAASFKDKTWILTWAYAIRAPVVPFWFSALIQGKWMMAGAMLIYFIIDASVFTCILKVDILLLKSWVDRCSGSEEKTRLIDGTEGISNECESFV